MNGPVTGPVTGPERAPMFMIRGDASDDEVAALVAVLQGLAAARPRPVKRPPLEWSAPHRAVRAPLAAGPGGWRSSALPR